MTFRRGSENIKSQLGVGRLRDEKIVEILKPFQFEILDNIKRRHIKHVLEQYAHMEVIDQSDPITIDKGYLVFDIVDKTTYPNTVKRVTTT
jgi:hypothetical protein